MIVSCPQCSTGYLLPDHLLGGAGARIRCPRCQNLFTVARDGAPAAAIPSGSAAAAADPPPAAARPLEPTEETWPQQPQPAPAEGIALAVLNELSARVGQALDQARLRGRLFSEFGGELMDAFDEYRRRAGQQAGTAPFRAALRERWGVDLVPLRAAEERPAAKP